MLIHAIKHTTNVTHILNSLHPPQQPPSTQYYAPIPIMYKDGSRQSQTKFQVMVRGAFGDDTEGVNLPYEIWS